MKSKLPMIYQAESVECGLASLAMVLQYYHQAVTLSELRRDYPLNTSGSSIGLLILIARAYQFDAKVYRIEITDLYNQRLPLILHWNINHFVVLKRIKKDSVIIHDPARGVIKLTIKDLSNSFTGIILQCLPIKPLLPQQHNDIKPIILKWIKKSHRLHGILLKSFLFILIYQAFIILFPKIFQKIFSSELFNQNVTYILVLIAGFIWLRILSFTAKLSKDLCVLKLGTELSQIISLSVAKKLFSLPYQYFFTRHPNEILNRFNTVEQIRQIITNGMIEGIWDGIVCSIMLVAMFASNLYLGILTLTCSIIYGMARYYFSPKILASAYDMDIKRTEEQVSLFDNIRAIQPIKLFSKETQRLSHWTKSYNGFLQSNYHLKRYKVFIDSFKELIIGLEMIVAVSLMYLGQSISMSVLYVYLLYRQIYSSAFYNAIEKWHDVKLLYIYHQRLDDIIFPYSNNPNTLSIEPSLPVALMIKTLSFRYSPFEDFIFENLNIEIQKGEMVVLIGASGKGKTTLLKIMMGLLPSTTGLIQLSTANIACVMQQDCLLSGTIAQNISFSSSPNLSRVIYYAKLMGIYEEIMTMPMRFDTLVGDLGANLSGGQKQRILLARALYIEPEILFLDEATSHLDADNEVKVNAAIKQLGITCIMIAHRQQTICMADRAITI